MTYSAKIKAFRESRKLTHQQFADTVGVSRGAIQQWENGATAPKRVNQPAVAKFMGISVSELMADGQQTDVIPPDTKPNQPLAGESIALGATNINVNRRAPSDAHDVVAELGALLAGVEPGRMGTVISALADLARNPNDEVLRDSLARLMAPAAFIQKNQRTG